LASEPTEPLPIHSMPARLRAHGVLTGARPRVPLDDVVGEVALVERGLRACVQNGTARRLRRLDELGVCGKTGTAEVGRGGENNAWFAGYLPPLGDEGVQMCFCAVVYWVQDAVHGGEAAGQLVVDFLAAVEQDPALRRRFLAEVGR
jgi:membrane carboxypeptidase/penicillin-binding protein